jgi:hypothetical protein
LQNTNFSRKQKLQLLLLELKNTPTSLNHTGKSGSRLVYKDRNLSLVDIPSNPGTSRKVQ